MCGIIEVKVLALMVLVAGVHSWCVTKNWYDSLRRTGWSTCGTENNMIKINDGFCRNNQAGAYDDVDNLGHAYCCVLEQWNITGRTQEANWGTTMSRIHTWSLCPTGYFLTGIYRRTGDGRLNSFKKGQCHKPRNHPSHYGQCEDYSIHPCFRSGENCCRCPYGKAVVGLYRDGCSDVGCITRLRCCSPVE